MRGQRTTGVPGRHAGASICGLVVGRVIVYVVAARIIVAGVRATHIRLSGIRSAGIRRACIRCASVWRTRVRSACCTGAAGGDVFTACHGAALTARIARAIRIVGALQISGIAEVAVGVVGANPKVRHAEGRIFGKPAVGPAQQVALIHKVAALRKGDLLVEGDVGVGDDVFIEVAGDAFAVFVDLKKAEVALFAGQIQEDVDVEPVAQAVFE